ncbi:hypothetical protein C6T56_25030 [Burkholderia multivorans]|nr:hypothetical protein C6T56_25030 [Burkholderia multivorans]
MRLDLGAPVRRARRVACRALVGRPRRRPVRPVAPPPAHARRRSGNDPIYSIPTASAHLTKLNHSEIDAVL